MGDQTKLDDDRNITSSKTSSDTSQHTHTDTSSHREYTRIYKSDVWEFIIDSPWYFVEVEQENVNEYVFEIRYTGDDSPIDDPVSIRWYTSVDMDTDVSRPAGEDAMKLVLMNLRVGKPILRPARAQRIETWRDNITEKIYELENRFDTLPMCPECGSVLVIVTRHTGKQFRGCSNYYPDQECTYSESL